MTKKLKGKIIVFEGIDGAGKSTQIKLLKDYLKEQKIPAVFFKFPRHGKPVFGKIVDDYLRGKFGDPTKVNAYLTSAFYAADRGEEKNAIKEAKEKGKLVVIDRYVGSNMAHQLVKIKDKKGQQRFISWLEQLEFTQMGLPKPDKIFYFKVPFEATKKLLESSRNKHVKGKDGHEKNLVYLQKVKRAYETIANNKKEWQIIECGEKRNKIMSRKAILEKIKEGLGLGKEKSSQ